MGLLDRLSSEFAIHVDEDHVLTHSDVVLLVGTTKSGRRWDPPSSKYSFQKVFGKQKRDIVPWSKINPTPPY